ncbi:DUF3606 domain-containing protein [Pseudomonas sp. W4I3]
MNTSEAWEVKHWTKEFGVTEQQRQRRGEISRPRPKVAALK